MAGKDGDGSYRKLIASIYGMNKTNNTLIQDYIEYGNIRPDYIILQLSLLFVQSGGYFYNTGKISFRNSYGYYWEREASLNNGSYYLFFYQTRLYPQFSNENGYGRSLRCVAKSFE